MIIFFLIHTWHMCWGPRKFWEQTDLRCTLVLRSSELSREDNSVNLSSPALYMHYSKTKEVRRGRPLDQTVQVEEGEETGWSEPERVVLKLWYLSKTEKKKCNIITASFHFIVVVTQKVVQSCKKFSIYRKSWSKRRKSPSYPSTPSPLLSPSPSFPYTLPSPTSFCSHLFTVMCPYAGGGVFQNPQRMLKFSESTEPYICCGFSYTYIPNDEVWFINQAQ